MTDITGSLHKIQMEETSFNAPISQNLMRKMGATNNYILDIIHPVGSVIHSMLSEAQFATQDVLGAWCLADGRSCNGTLYHTVTGATTVPDLRGMFLRGKNNSRADGKQNPDGEISLGTYTADKYASHTHTLAHDITGTNHVSYNTIVPSLYINYADTLSIGSSGSNETAPKNCTVNIFIRIN